MGISEDPARQEGGVVADLGIGVDASGRVVEEDLPGPVQARVFGSSELVERAGLLELRVVGGELGEGFGSLEEGSGAHTGELASPRSCRQTGNSVLFRAARFCGPNQKWADIISPTIGVTRR